MHPTNLDLDDSKKVQPRRAGLTRNYGHNLLQSINRPQKEEQSESRASNANNIGNISGGISDTKLKRLQKRVDKGSDKENQSGSSASSAMKYKVPAEDKDVLQLPDDSDDGAQFIGDSSDDESSSKFSADMTKTSFGSKNNKSNQTSKPPVLNQKSTKKRTPDSKPSISLKRKNEESESGHDPEVDLFGNMQSSKKKLKSYIQAHKEPKLPRPGANSISAKRSYGKLKKTTTYGKKSSPAKGFKNYARGSSPSLISDDGEDKLHDYTTDTPTKIQSPTKGGFVRPDFSDDDLSDLDLPSSLKQLNSEPSMQFQQLQRYDDDDIMDEAEELAKKLHPDAITGIKDFEREDSSDLDDYTGARCPMCNEPVAAEDLEAFGEMNTRKQEKFCLSHQRKSAHSDWMSKGYPDIDWATLDSRIASHHAFIKKIIGGAPCHSRSVLDETIRAGKDRNLMKSTTNLIPGYYGSRGLRVMSENIMSKFTPKLKKRAPIDRLIAARGPTAFVELVVVPEVTVLLIKEDMKVDDEAAREILKESCEIGDLVNEEIKDVVKLKPTKQINGSSDEEEGFDL
ncbi:hypothetical protein EYC80_004815 [Monilinia laxa]|uniref:Restriction of telomere capping protein 4 n=1 Tax=Monilinia laxa TaxID=61186 RepID=A0A5N6KHY7_MONLA|nr:hypothetical protein EYC80_004815 [Monilinia laxa]